MIKRLAQHLSPAAYRYARKVYLNGRNHARWWWSERHPASPRSRPATATYTSEYYATWSDWDFDGFARTLADRFHPRSILDVGCGAGLLLAPLARGLPDALVFGLEHSTDALREAQARGLRVDPVDLAHALPPRSPADSAPWIGPFDLVICLEVAEHLPAWRAQPLADFLARRGRTLVFSAAHPGQGGILHLNEQPATYWIRRFARAGLSWDAAATDAVRHALHALRLPPWYAQNLLVFTAPATHPATRS